MRAQIIAILVLHIFVCEAEAGAWTLSRNHIEIFSGVITSRATQRFDQHGTPAGKIFFNKLFAQNWMEYGLTDALTVFAAPEYVFAEYDMHHKGVTRERSTSVAAGARLLLSRRIGVLSLQTSLKSSGAFSMPTSAGGEDGLQLELRLLYGWCFKLFERDVFFDAQIGERWSKRPRPNELVIDTTAGFWVTEKHLIMLQSFNMISTGKAKSPYEDYRLHKVQASFVQRITSRWSLQGGYFFALAGQNIVQEQGFMGTIWYRT